MGAAIIVEEDSVASESYSGVIDLWRLAGL